MKFFAFFASILIAASAFNLTEYHLGVISSFNFNKSQVKDSFTCIDALKQNSEQIYQLLMSKNFESIAANLGDMLVQYQSIMVSSCANYIQDEINYIAANTNISNLKQTIEDNLKQNYIMILQDIGQWYSLVAERQDFAAGMMQTQIMLILTGVQQIIMPPSPQVNSSDIVPLNVSEFFSEYYGMIFEILGINEQPNVTALVQCYGSLENVTLSIVEMKKSFATYDFEQKLSAVQYLFGLGFETVRNCEGAAETEELVLGPIVKAFSEDPVHFTFEVIDRVLSSLTVDVEDVQGEVTAIELGEYSNAGADKGGLLYNIFNGLVKFTSTE